MNFWVTVRLFMVLFLENVDGWFQSEPVNGRWGDYSCRVVYRRSSSDVLVHLETSLAL
jgi:hypothetical protein